MQSNSNIEAGLGLLLKHHIKELEAAGKIEKNAVDVVYENDQWLVKPINGKSLKEIFKNVRAEIAASQPVPKMQVTQARSMNRADRRRAAKLSKRRR